MNVSLSSHLRSYTGGAARVNANGADLTEVLADLDRQYPGLRFRIIDEQDAVREHIMIFVNQTKTPDLRAQVRPSDEIHIIGAISGG